jgi:hypothetical protein
MPHRTMPIVKVDSTTQAWSIHSNDSAGGYGKLVQRISDPKLKFSWRWAVEHFQSGAKHAMTESAFDDHRFVSASYLRVSPLARDCNFRKHLQNSSRVPLPYPHFDPHT